MVKLFKDKLTLPISMHGIDERWNKHKKNYLRIIKESSEDGMVFPTKSTSDNEVYVNSGSDALYTALVALDVSGKVIVPAYTYIATVNAVLRANCEPVFVDVELNGLMGYDQIFDMLEKDKDINAVVYPTIGGNMPSQPTEIKECCKQYGVKLIHDGAQSYDSKYIKGILELSAYSWGDLNIISYDPTKVVGNMIGTGGGIFVKDRELRKRIRSFVNQGYLNGHAGINSKLGLAARRIIEYNKNIHHTDMHVDRRMNICSKYFFGSPTYFQDPNIRSNHSRATFMFDNTIDRNWVQRFLKTKQIETKVYYQTAAHLQPQSQPFIKDIYAFPNTESIVQRSLSIPIYPELTDEQVDYIVDAMSEADDLIKDK